MPASNKHILTSDVLINKRLKFVNFIHFSKTFVDGVGDKVQSICIVAYSSFIHE